MPPQATQRTPARLLNSLRKTSCSSLQVRQTPFRLGVSVLRNASRQSGAFFFFGRLCLGMVRAPK